MGSVLIVRADDILLDKGYGFADIDRKTPNSPSTKFCIGSLTKQFTAACILLLEERGKLHLGDPIKNYLSDIPTAWEKITFLELLTHSSGIPDLTKFAEYNAAQSVRVSPEELVAYFRDKPLDFPPGKNFRYSNSGYILLGCLIEKISGQNYADFLRKNIFDPAGMHDSGYDFNSAPVEQEATGYKISPDGVVPAGYIDMTRAFSAGGLYSTTHDLLRWQQALYGGKILRSESLTRMTTPLNNSAGLGIGIFKFMGQKVYYHAGEIAGFNSQVSYFPETQTSVIVLSNLEGVGASDIAPKLAKVAFGKSIVLPSERPALSLPQEKLAKYVGTYEVSPGISVIISLNKGQLFVEVPGRSPKEPIFPASEQDFFLRSEDAELKFLSDQKGEIISLTAKEPGEPVVKATRKR